MLPQPAALSVLIVTRGHSLEKRLFLVSAATASVIHPQARAHMCLRLLVLEIKMFALISLHVHVPVADAGQHDAVHRLRP